jgi:glycosyltransferase involved in cell wall biosynthesis/ADP-heptose:LPS heptosyltransferase
MNRLLIVSDSPALASGQARVVRELAKRFDADGAEVAVLGWFHLGAQAYAEPLPYRVLDGGKKTQPGLAAPVLQAFEPDTVLCIGDPDDFAWLAKARAQGGRFRLVGYLNIEAAPIPVEWEEILDGFDVIITTSEWGAAQLGRSYARWVHHGVDTSVFCPLGKPATFMGRDTAKTFVVLLNGQNTARKALAPALEGFAQFARRHDDVLCYANTQPTPGPSGSPGVNLHDLVLRLGIQDRVCFNPQNRGPLDTIDDEALNQLYGLADVLLMPSQGEGFGLPILEAMATRTVPIATRGFSMLELLADGRGDLIPATTMFPAATGQKYHVVDPRDIAARLEVVYEQWRRRQLGRYHAAGAAYALSHSWDHTYEGIVEAMTPQSPRLARGATINGRLRQQAREVSRGFDKAVAVLKIGGLGDMLQTTVVVRAAARKYQCPIVVFCNAHGDVFAEMPEVAKIVQVPDTVQNDVARSIADCYFRCIDVRYVSITHGEAPTDYAKKHQYFYTHWAGSNARIADLDLHTTAIMLRSLGLEEFSPEGIQPVFTPRAETDLEIATSGMDYICVASGVGSIGGLKRWPAPAWEVFIQRQMKATQCAPVQIGGPEDPQLKGVFDFRGRSLAETATILEKAKCLVAVEGGMVHLARAVGTPSVVMFGPTPMVSFGYDENINLGQHHCQPCFWSLPAWGMQNCTRGSAACLNLPPAQDVVEATKKLVTQRSQ